MVQQKRRSYIGLNDESVRKRLATTRPSERSDIGHVWREQKRLSQERWQLGPEEESLFSELISVVKKKTATIKSKVNKTNKKTTKLKLNKAVLSRFNFKKKRTNVLGVLAFVFLAGYIVIGSNNRGNDSPQSLGASSVAGSDGPAADDGKTDEKPTFAVLYPADKKELVAVTRKTPNGQLLHTYKDTVEGIEVEVTQQELPESFKSAPNVELEKIAKNFQATDIIQIDEAFVYHGLDEKTRVQSLFTIKNDTLISIRSAEKLLDDTWAAYILSLAPAAED